MSILPQVARIIVKEHKHKPIIGSAALIGRQSVLLSESQALALIRSEGVEPNPNYKREIDTDTKFSEGGITDRAFFSMFTDAKVIALDVSAYENAEIVHDLNTPLPDQYRNTADFIFNGSCMDNLFDPASAMRCMSKMLKPGGRILHLEHGTPVNNAMLCYSPEWFFGFYAVNNYDDCRNYICAFGSGTLNPWAVYRWYPHTHKHHYEPNNIGAGDFFNIVIATKGTNSTDDKAPIQMQYQVMQNGDYLADKNFPAGRAEPFEFSRTRPPASFPRVIKANAKAALKRLLFAFGHRVRIGPSHKYILERLPHKVGYL